MTRDPAEMEFTLTNPRDVPTFCRIVCVRMLRTAFRMLPESRCNEMLEP